MNPSEIRLLQKISEWPNRCATLNRNAKPGSLAMLDGLVEKGFVKIGRELSGPLAMPTGERCISLTREGVAALNDSRPK